MNNKKILILTCVLLILGIGYLVKTNSIEKNKMEKAQTADAMLQKETQMMKEQKTTDIMMEKDVASESEKMTESAKYILHTKAALAKTMEDNTKTVLFFYASWCPTCKPADESFKANEAKIPEGVAVVRVNYNDTDTDQDEKDLAKKYGVTYQHTFVQIDSEGKQVTKWNGGKIEELLTNLK